MGKGQSPTPDELKFVYEMLAEGYSDADILAKYDELEQHGKLESLPYREDIRFIRQRRKEYEAAKAVLKGSFELQADPYITKAKESHFSEIYSFIIKLIKATRTPYAFEVESDTEYPSLQLLEVNKLFQCVKEHLSSDELWSSYVQWSEKVCLYIDSCQELIRQFIYGAEVKEFIGTKPDKDAKWFYRPLLRYVNEKALGKEIKDFDQLPDEPIELRALELEEVEKRDPNHKYKYYSFDEREFEYVEPQICKRFLDTEAVNNIVVLFDEVKALEDKFRPLIQNALLSRSYSSTSCRLCPGQSKDSS